MAWNIECCLEKEKCAGAYAYNIVDLLDNYLDDSGYFVCGCGGAGYVEKRFKQQEEGEIWEPFLRGAIRFWDPGENDTYYPFVFLVSGNPMDKPDSAWFAYYKDTRTKDGERVPGGKLKMGHGPGGPPVVGFNNVVELVEKLKGMHLIE